MTDRHRAARPGRSLPRAVLAAVVVALLTATGLATPTDAALRTEARASRPAWVAVSVARLWETPSSPRPVDAPALTAPVHVRAWLRGMTLDERRALSFHSDTETLMGERVMVLRRRDGWAKVVVPDQPSQKDPRGYPGWVPLRQLSFTAPAATGTLATVTARTTVLRRDGAPSQRVVEVSAGTSLPFVGRAGRFARVVTPSGRTLMARADDVSVHAAGTAALPFSARGLLRSARTFTGEWYLWGGLSGFGIDCSGLTWLAHRLRGVGIPRDALPQSQSGRRVARSHLRPGDLLFLATDGLVHHVMMWAGRGRVIQARATGTQVGIGPMEWTEYSGARRYRP